MLKSTMTELSEMIAAKSDAVNNQGLSSWHDIVEKHGADNIERYASFKRFIELYSGDDIFRSEFSKGDLSRLSKISISVDSRLLNNLVDFSLIEPDENEPKILSSFRQFMIDCSQNRVGSTKLEVSRKFELWRLAQYNRCSFIFNQKTNRQIVHAPLALELTKGCSVGCWFCGISADSLEGASPFDSNQDLFLEILLSIKELAGDLNQLSFLYWATDPLDNPDYEKYLARFAEVFGFFPQTTTAQAPKYIERVRNIINLTNNSTYCTVNRFSILSKAGLYKLFKEFTPLELASTLLVMQQPSSVTKKADAGRASTYYSARSEEKEEVVDTNQSYQQSTIACVSGFKVNLVTKKIQLMSPTQSSEKYPDGFIVYAEKKLSPNLTPLEFFYEYLNSLNSAKLVISHGVTFDVENSNLYQARLESAMSILKISGKLDFEIFQELESQTLTIEELTYRMEHLGHPSFYVNNKINHYVLQGVISYDSM